jgi:hypothetical protein
MRGACDWRSEPTYTSWSNHFEGTDVETYLKRRRIGTRVDSDRALRPRWRAARTDHRPQHRHASRYQSCLHPAMAPGPSAGEIRTRISRIPNSGNFIRASGNEIYCATRSYVVGATRIALRAATLISASAHQRWVRSGLCHESPCAEIAVGRLLRPRRGPGACNPVTRVQVARDAERGDDETGHPRHPCATVSGEAGDPWCDE